MMAEQESAFLAIVFQNHVNNIAMVASAAVLLYEQIITVGQEVDLVWSRPFSHATVLFGANRVFVLGYALSSFVYAQAQETCDPVLSMWRITLVIYMVCLVFVLVVWGAFSAVRIYAVGAGAWRLAACTFALCLVPPLMNTYRLIVMVRTGYEGPVRVGNSCGPSWTGITDIENTIMEYATRLSGIISDAIVIGVTWRAVCQTRRAARNVGIKAPLSELLFREGTLYFIGLLVLNVVTLLGYFLELAVDIPFLIYVFQSIIVARFFLHVRGLEANDSSNGTLPMLHFASVPPDTDPGLSPREARVEDVESAEQPVPSWDENIAVEARHGGAGTHATVEDLAYE